MKGVLQAFPKAKEFVLTNKLGKKAKNTKCKLKDLEEADAKFTEQLREKYAKVKKVTIVVE